MPLDLEIKSFLAKLNQNGIPDITGMTATAARTVIDHGAYAVFPITNDADIDITNQTITDTQLPIRIYTPKIKTGALPALIFFHGGGFVLGTLDESDYLCVSIAKRAHCVVISIAYRLAPEFPFPTPPDDCYDAAVWVASQAKTLNIMPNKIFIGGENAGGCLAAVVALMARDRDTRLFCGQILIYPLLDRNFDRRSYLKYAETSVISRKTLMWFWEQYLPDKSAINNPYAVPFKTNSLTALPPALVITAECDPLHDEGEAYTEKLKQAHSLLRLLLLWGNGA